MDKNKPQGRELLNWKITSETLTQNVHIPKMTTNFDQHQHNSAWTANAFHSQLSVIVLINGTLCTWYSIVIDNFRNPKTKIGGEKKSSNFKPANCHIGNVTQTLFCEWMNHLRNCIVINCTENMWKDSLHHIRRAFLSEPHFTANYKSGWIHLTDRWADRVVCHPEALIYRFDRSQTYTFSWLSHLLRLSLTWLKV